MFYYSSRFVKDTNAFWYFCADIIYVFFPWEVFINNVVSTPRNFATFSLSMTVLSTFEKGSGSLKNLLFEAGWNREYFVFAKFSDNLFALNQRDILLSSQFISEKRSSTFMPDRNKLVLSANMIGFSFSEHL